MKVKMILPSLTEAKSPFFRPIKYSLFPPLGLATLAAYVPADASIELQDEHVETLELNDEFDLEGSVRKARAQRAVQAHRVRGWMEEVRATLGLGYPREAGDVAVAYAGNGADGIWLSSSGGWLRRERCSNEQFAERGRGLSNFLCRAAPGGGSGARVRSTRT